MHEHYSSAKPRITEADALEAMIKDLRKNGVEAEEIHRQVVRIAVVDLDDLNALLKAA